MSPMTLSGIHNNAEHILTPQMFNDKGEYPSPVALAIENIKRIKY